VLILRRWCPKSRSYGHGWQMRIITHVAAHGFGIPDGHVMLSMRTMNYDERRIAFGLAEHIGVWPFDE